MNDTYTAWEGSQCIAQGSLERVALKSKQVSDSGSALPLLVFDPAGKPVDLDLRGSVTDVAARYAAPASPSEIADTETVPRGAGRPKLGVVGREITLLPRHWEWLSSQPGGASVCIRRLIEEARRRGNQKDQQRLSKEAAFRFMQAMAGNERGFEEANRALFAGNRERFSEQTAGWPAGVRDHLQALAEPAFQALAAQS